MKQTFYICNHCGNIISMIKDAGVPVMCCGENMKEIIPGTTEASAEKHIPVYEISGNEVLVTVGSALHPMQPEHYIEYIFLQTEKGSQCVKLSPDCEPKARFAIVDGDKVEAVYAFCNLHSLWKA